MPNGFVPARHLRRNWKFIAPLVGVALLAPIAALLGVRTVLAASTLPAGQSLTNACLVAANNGSHICMQGDGNLVLYDITGHALWWSGTQDSNGTTVFMQGDGNLVIRDIPTGNAIWNSQTGGHPNAAYQLIDGLDENVHIDGPSGGIWWTNTHQDYVVTAKGTFAKHSSATFTFWYTEYEEEGSVLVPFFFADNSQDNVDYETVYWSTQNKSYIVWLTDYFWNDVTNGMEPGLPFTVDALDRHDHDEWWGRSNQYTEYTVYPATYWNNIGGTPSDSILSEKASQNDGYWVGAIVAYPAASSEDACCGSVNTVSPAITAPNLGN